MARRFDSISRASFKRRKKHQLQTTHSPLFISTINSDGRLDWSRQMYLRVLLRRVKRKENSTGRIQMVLSLVQLSFSATFIFLFKMMCFKNWRQFLLGNSFQMEISIDKTTFCHLPSRNLSILSKNEVWLISSFVSITSIYRLHLRTIVNGYIKHFVKLCNMDARWVANFTCNKTMQKPVEKMWWYIPTKDKEKIYGEWCYRGF